MRFDNTFPKHLEEKGFDFQTIADEGSKSGCSWWITLDKNNRAGIYIDQEDRAIVSVNGWEQKVTCLYPKQVIEVLNLAIACLGIA